MTEEAVSNTLPIGSLLHWYEVQEILGRGGYGITYLAFDRNLHRKVAIKEYLPTDFAQRVNNNTVHPMTAGHRDLYSWGLDRFLSEARTLAKFNHKAIIKVQSVFEQNNTAYMVMEYEEGDDLSVAYGKNKPFNQEQLLKLFLPIIEGLSLVHDAGFIHRDIKPANIYVRKDGSPVLLDFGSARQTLRSQSTALTTLVTTGYAPFEQYNQSDDEQGVWTDIYALGSTLYYCITGDKPVDALKRSANLIKRGRDVYEPISEVQIPGFSQNFLRAIDHALMFHPERRPHSVRYWGDMLSGKVGVASVTEDMFKINQPGDHYYDLDSTVVMSPIKSSSLVKQAAAENSNAQNDLGRYNDPPLEEIEDKTVVQKRPGELHKSRHEAAPPQPAFDSSAIQSISSQQLDKITEALAQPPEQPAAQFEPEQLNARTGMQPRVRTKQPFEQWLKKLTQWVAEFQHHLPKNIPQQLQNILHNKSILVGSLSVVLVLFIIILTLIFVSEEKTAGRLAEQSDGSKMSESVSVKDRFLEPATKPLPVNASPVEQLLQQARSEQAQGRFIEDEGVGAYYHYRKVLELEPQHQESLKALEVIEQHYADLVTENVQDNNWQQAQINFSKFKIVSGNQTQIGYFEQQFAARDAQLDKVNLLLRQADRYFAQNKLTKPESQSALALYKEVLSIDPDNQTAQEGINKIVAKLGNFLQNQLTIHRVKYAENTYNKIVDINPNASILADTEPVIAKLLAQRNEVIKLLRQAKADFIRGNIIVPVDNNALEKYRSVIDIDPNHTAAKQGIETIYQYYLSDFNRYLEEHQYDRADIVLSNLSRAKFDRKRIVKLQKRLEKERVTASSKPH